ncbi:hypothetical protein ACWIVX_04525, partial [Enterobacter asburiae]
MMRLICRFSLLYHEKEHGVRDTIRDVIEHPFFPGPGAINSPLLHRAEWAPTYLSPMLFHTLTSLLPAVITFRTVFTHID